MPQDWGSQLLQPAAAAAPSRRRCYADELDNEFLVEPCRSDDDELRELNPAPRCANTRGLRDNHRGGAAASRHQSGYGYEYAPPSAPPMPPPAVGDKYQSGYGYEYAPSAPPAAAAAGEAPLPPPYSPSEAPPPYSPSEAPPAATLSQNRSGLHGTAHKRQSIATTGMVEVGSKWLPTLRALCDEGSWEKKVITFVFDRIAALHDNPAKKLHMSYFTILLWIAGTKGGKKAFDLKNLSSVAITKLDGSALGSVTTGFFELKTTPRHIDAAEFFEKYLKEAPNINIVCKDFDLRMSCRTIAKWGGEMNIESILDLYYQAFKNDLRSSQQTQSNSY